jgi:hypothetical protein
MTEFLRQLFEAAFSPDQIAPKVLAVLGAVVSFLAKLGYDRWYSEVGVSTQTIISDLDKGTYLTKKRRRRLQHEANLNLSYWRRDTTPPLEGRKIKVRLKKDRALVVKDLLATSDETACPSGDISQNSTPLFFSLSVTETVTSNTDASASPGVELNRKFSALEARYKLSRELISKLDYSDGDYPIVWVAATNLIVRRQEDVVALLDELQSVIRERLPIARMILEIYLSNDIKEQLLKYVVKLPPEDKEQPKTFVSNVGPVRYVQARHRANEALAVGIVLGRLPTPENHKVPLEILEGRIQGCLEEVAGSFDSWTTVSIFGPPGSGKTELANELGARVQENLKAIVLVASTPQLLDVISRLPLHEINEGWRQLANAIYETPGQYELIPNHFQEQIERQGFADAIYDALRCRKQPLVIVVDDIHAYGSLNAAILYLRGQFSRWNSRFILIGRVRVPRIDSLEATESQTAELFVEKQCDLWNLAQSKCMLEDWLQGQTTAQEIDQILKSYWQTEQDTLSLYLLRIVAKHFRVLQTSPGKLMKEEIRNLLSSIITELRAGQLQRPAHLLLEKVKEMLEAGRSKEDVLTTIGKPQEIDPVLLFGVISWFSIFEEGDALITSSKVLDWASSYISSKDEAQILIDAGITANVFDGQDGLYKWDDPLVAGVCAALYLGHEITEDKLGENDIVKRVERLNSSNSIDFLRLSLDPEVLLEIIQAITAKRPELASVIDKLLTPEFVTRLAGDCDWADALGSSFWRQGQSISPSQIAPIAVTLSKLILYSPWLQERCWHEIENDGHDAQLALAIKAVQFQDSSEYFAEVNQHAPPYLLPKAIEMAARFWSSEGANSLCSSLLTLIDLNYEEDEVRRIWMQWCHGQRGNSIYNVVIRLIEKSLDDSEHENAYAILVEECLKDVIGETSPTERIKCVPQVSFIRRKIPELAQKGRYRLANRIVKWIAYFYGSDIVDKKSSWKVDKSGKYAWPLLPDERLTVGVIFANIRNVYPHFVLASSNEVSRLWEPSEGQLELVRDQLPSDFQYDQNSIRTIAPVNLRLWDGSSAAQFVTREEKESARYFWRPRFNIQTMGF